jgi:FkbM family methyltransferase
MAGWRVLDIGGHIGAFSRAAAERGATVDAYEPAAACMATFMLNTSGLPVVLHQSAVLGYTGRGRLRHCPVEGETSGHTLMIPHQTEVGEDVSVVEFASVLEGRPVDLVKLDAEGAEYPIIAGTPDDHLRLVKRWVIEFHAFDHFSIPWGRMALLGFRCDWQQGCEHFLLAGFSQP